MLLNKEEKMKNQTGRGSMAVAILCIDDDLDFLTSIKFSLREAYEVHTASSITEAIKVLEKTSVDLALLDVGLGEEDGIEGIK
jgi:DNA-binding response OmpR family regulator